MVRLDSQAVEDCLDSLAVKDWDSQAVWAKDSQAVWAFKVAEDSQAVQVLVSQAV